MGYPWIKALHYLGLALLLGGPVFWHFIRPGDRPGPSSPRGWVLLAAGSLRSGAGGYLAAGRAGRDSWGELLPGDVFYFLIGSRYGLIVLGQSALAAVSALIAALRLRGVIGKGLLAATGLGVVYLVALASHAAADGPLGLLFDMLHLAGLAGCGGGW